MRNSKNAKRRGPYHTFANGELPKRRQEEAIKRLAHNAATRRHQLEVFKKRLRRRNIEIERLNEQLDAVNKKIVIKEIQEEDIILENKRLQKEIAALKSQVRGVEVLDKGSDNLPVPIAKKKRL
jgi:hypothetical protein